MKTLGLRPVAPSGTSVLGGASVCDDGPSGYSEEALRAYGKACGEDKALSFLEESLGVDRSSAERLYRGEITVRDVYDTFLTANEIPVDPTKLVDENGDIDWEEAAGAAGAGAAYSACSSQPETAPFASLCAEGGRRLGKALYGLASQAYKGWKTILWGSSKAPSAYLVGTSRGELLSIIAWKYVTWGQTDYLFNMLLWRGVALSAHRLARSLEGMAQSRGKSVSGLDLLVKNGLIIPGDDGEKPSVYDFLLASGVKDPVSAYDILETEVLEKAVEVPSGPLPPVGFSSTYGPGGQVVKKAPYDSWAIEHTSETFHVACAGIGLDEKKEENALVQKRTGASGEATGGEATNLCYGPLSNVHARVFYHPRLRTLCKMGREHNLLAKDKVLQSLEDAFYASVIEVSRMKAPGAIFSVAEAPIRVPLGIAEKKGFPWVKAGAALGAFFLLRHLVDRKK